jgi:CDP-glucose 4,6-dehydratase
MGKEFLYGHKGLKESWLVLALAHCGSRVKGFSLTQDSERDLFHQSRLDQICESSYGDIRDPVSLSKETLDFKPQVIFHLAAQPLVIQGFQNPIETFQTNTLGTVNVLEVARVLDSLEVLVVITTDKVYGTTANPKGFKELDRLGRADPYSASKVCTELVASCYRNSYFSRKGVKLVTVRLGM